MIRPSKEEGARIRAAGAAEGKSVQRFILDILAAYMQQAGPDQPPED